MACYIYCLVDGSGSIYVKDGAVSYLEVAAGFGLDENACDTYRFDVAGRRMVADRGSPTSDRVAQSYWDQHVGSPEKLKAFTAEGRLTKDVLGCLLGDDDREGFLQSCRFIGKQRTIDCAAKLDPCLYSGCTLEGEICLEALLRAGREYHKSCAVAWRILFEDPQRRTQVWIH